MFTEIKNAARKKLFPNYKFLIIPSLLFMVFCKKNQQYCNKQHEYTLIVLRPWEETPIPMTPKT